MQVRDGDIPYLQLFNLYLNYIGRVKWHRGTSMDFDFQDYLEEQLQDPEFAKRYSELEPARHIAQQVIMLRQKEGITQAELAKRVGTQQSAISRLENASSVPSLSFVQRVAQALGADIHVILEPQAT